MLVKGTDNEAVEKDSSGNIKLYSDEVLSVSAKGVVSASTDSSTLIANGTSGYHAATIVIDSLSDAAGGDGIDVLIGIEGLLFGFLSSGDHGWLPSANEHGPGIYKVWTESGDKTVTTMAISYMAEDFVHWDYNPNTNQWSEVQKYKVNYTGTNFDDEISFDNTTSFKSEVGSSFTSSDATTYTFNGGSGDDSFIGSSASGVKSVAVYSGAKAAYNIAEIGDTNVFTVTHKIPDALGGTGVDTLTNIDAIKFGYQTSSEEIVRLNVETGSTGGSARYFRGTMFNDDIDNASGDFAGLLSGNDVFGKSGGGVDNFYAGGGTDILQMGGFYSRYSIKYDATDGHLEIVDTLTTNLGGDGTVNVKDVESIQFYNNVFELRIAGGDGSDATNYSLYMDHTTLGTVKIADGATIDGSGNILTAGGLNIFAVSQTPSEHAPTYSWEQMLGASVGTLAAPLDMNVHVKPYLDGTTASLAPNQFGSTVATQTAGISVDVNQTSVTDFSSFDGSGSSADITATKNVYEGFFQGFGNDDVMYGGAGNDTFIGGPGDDVFNGRGENQTDWWDSFNTGDTVQYIGVEARYTISGPTTDVDADSNGFTDTRGFKVDTAGDTLSYFTVTDSLPLAQGGDGTDYLINIEKIRFQDGDYHLSIRDVGNSWDTWTQLFGTSGNDDFTSYTDDSADPAAKEYNINGGAGDDLIVGGAEPSGDTYSWGDSAVYEAQEQNFDISIEELTFVADSASATDDWDGDGDVDCDDIDCASSPNCNTEICNNGIDDDFDGDADCADSDCAADANCQAGNFETNCSDGLDDDGDGTPNSQDDAPQNPDIQTDQDSDGIDDSVDPSFIDSDNDGLVDENEYFILNENYTMTKETLDTYLDDMYREIQVGDIIKIQEVFSASNTTSTKTFDFVVGEYHIVSFVGTSTIRVEADDGKFVININGRQTKWIVVNPADQLAQNPDTDGDGASDSDDYFSDNSNYTQSKEDLDGYQLDPYRVPVSGDIIKIFMITAAGAEGIDLKNVRFVHLIEPYWHPVRLEQVIGRARRICSHDQLPEKLRTVDVYLYLMTFT